jgi:hypothetical protein
LLAVGNDHSFKELATLSEGKITHVWSVGPVRMTLIKTPLESGQCHWSYAFEFDNLGRIAATDKNGVSFNEYVRHMFESVESDFFMATDDHDLQDRVAKYLTEFPFLCREVPHL